MGRPKRYGSEAEKQAAYRARKKGIDFVEKEAEAEAVTSETGGVEPGKVEEKKDRPMTRTDRLFEARLPGYYIYQQDAVERACWRCGEPFKARLELNKFCSPTCKDGYLDEAFGKLKGVKK